MGNCLVLQEKVIKVMKPDGKILEYKAPIRVQQVLSDFSGHAISELHAFQHHLPDTKLLGGNLYYLVPLPLPSPQAKKKVRFSIPEDGDKKEKRAVRIKLIISKQELQEMLQKEGVSADSVFSQLQDQQRVERVDDTSDTDNNHKGSVYKKAKETHTI
ncbi:hypothetical protein GH714_038287 [Hevea brasiliensis]|uniref:Uncharacterized protein n=1 Tax=Hevea brasiliensis TaxID=3981 RepID=A0A6A6L500_HEVBR|nr:hypothetical protein GH714_038287 [Hevea brasiliensis]